MEIKKINTAKLSKKFTNDGYESRRNWVKKNTGVELTDSFDDTESLQGIIENHTGYVSIPMGIAAPLKITTSDYAVGEYAVPLCTVEGALVSSMTRGMIATTKSGGVKTTHIRQHISRAPFFHMESISEMKSFMDFIKNNFDKIKEVAESTTRFGKLVEIDQYPLQNYIILDFIYTTGNAAGQNMVSICTEKACKYIQEQTRRKYFLESNFSSDKKASAKNILRGRGHSVVSEAIIDASTLKRVLGCEAQDMIDLVQLAYFASSFAGTQGIQLHVANALTAIYMATGQDVACVAENSIAYTTVRPEKDGAVCFSLTMPSITVGTVGGGTRLLQQRKNLDMLNCTGGKHDSKKFAEIICASALCLELSLMAAIVSDRWVTAHQRYGRQHTDESESKNS